jgi:endonuclease/exonuclease/phosphatase family metal-dependent hydrolase
MVPALPSSWNDACLKIGVVVVARKWPCDRHRRTGVWNCCMKHHLLVLLVLAGCAGSAQRAAEPARAAACRDTKAGAVQPVRWLLPKTQRAQLDAWCAAVAPALVVAAEAAPGEPVDSLLVISWNVNVGGGDLPALIDDLRSGALTGGVAVRHFALLVQETFRETDGVPVLDLGMLSARGIEEHPRTTRRVGIDDVARGLGLSVIYAPSMRNGARNERGGREDRGNAILSTMPLHEPLALELPVQRQRRVAVAGTVRGRTSGDVEWELQLASVHLENRPAWSITGVAGRADQARWLAGHLPLAPLAVLGGDLNTWLRGSDEDAARVLLELYPSTPDELPAGATYTHPLLRRRLDYLFARVPGGAMTGYSRVGDSYGSDHHPVMGWVHLPRTASLSEP